MLSSKNLERLRKVLNITVPNYLSTEEKLKCLTSKDVAEIFGLSIDCINIILYLQSQSQWSKKNLYPTLVIASIIDKFNYNRFIDNLEESFNNINTR